MSAVTDIPVHLPKLLALFKTVVPKLVNNKHKGQYGRIGVIGGSLEYTGAPYFAAISSIRVGADLAHVFCHSNASAIIKSYSPDLIVHPVLDCVDAVERITPWLERLHVVVIGPGLGREPGILKTASNVLKLCMDTKKPVVIDADGLFLLNDNLSLICGQPNVILTPNVMEFQRLFGEDDQAARQKMSLLGAGVTVLEKGANDRIYLPHCNEVHSMPIGGSGRRCGGQGDLLSGSLATFFSWSLQSGEPNPALVAACASSYFVKKLNAAAFQKFGRSLLASDMVNQIPSVFQTEFENSYPQ
ncbi:ATP-dependent (S)-NAD(P)H-hydrate dehydratase isoform X1 [Drosophila sechellia]|uniref:ATP-dependent (S)-NAD(P)H-hydrate dehydratase n=2 Tax=Drosophila sechellia TaxID=7238 RepID=B4IFZ6_DROSE|nr:ATP-dependent (S)-NAD(P)H-hydrate dehydratase isoform X1 [Drosophila sechellia]EDW46583.1 GM14893 [Drosophila sechellia]